MAKRDEKKEESAAQVPKLTVAHYREITDLVRKYGSTIKVLQYWLAVTINEDGSIKAVLDFSEHTGLTMQKYEDFSPLKGIKYVGQGYVTYTPFNWCSDWLSQWEWWITKPENRHEGKGLLADPAKLKSLREKINTYAK